MKRAHVLAAIVVGACLVLAAAPFFGTKSIPVRSVVGMTLDEGQSKIFWSMRVPRVCLAFLAGAALAVSGMAFQALFRNPLATPFTLGVSSGAALGAAAYIRFGISFAVLGVSGMSVAAFLGAGLAIAIVYGLTRIRRGFSTATMLLAGVAISFFFSSVILFMQYTSDYRHSFRIVRWLMGRLEAVGFESLFSVLPFVASGTVIVVYLWRDLDLLTTGEDIAASRGVDVRRAKAIIFLAISLMVGGVVATCGPIGFVGMMAPHICRLLVGWEHRRLVPATVLFGGAFLVLCDTLARTLIAPVEIPVGVITALLGGPFFLWLLLGGSSERSVLGGYRQ